jgi:hypothetical protein
MPASAPPPPILPDWPPRAAALRHLARARTVARGVRGCAPDLPGPAVLLGANGAALALAGVLVARGIAVAVIEPDRAAAARLADHLRKLALPVAVASGRAALAGAALVVETRPDPGADARLRRALAAAPAGARAVRLAEGPGRGRQPRLRLVAPGSGLAEWFGDSAGGSDGRSLLSLSAALGCVPLRLPRGAEGPGARLLWRLEAAAEALAFAGLPPWEVDAAAEAAGFAIGPCALMDRLGVDAAHARRRRFGPVGAEPGVIARMVAEGRLGRRASVGWYRYPGGGGRVIDPLIEDLVREEAWFARRAPTPPGPDAAGLALVLALADEAARLIAEGAVARPADIDLAAVLALGFPVARGGPAWLLGRWGADAVAAGLAALAATVPELRAAGAGPGAPNRR